jgi:uncharacterized membrane protein
MKQINFAFYRAFLPVFYALFVLFNAPTFAAQMPNDGEQVYQSSFDDYRPFAAEKTADPKMANVQSDGGDHAEHAAHGMQHEMSPDQMANMPAKNTNMTDMSRMKHHDLSAMDSMQMAHQDVEALNHHHKKPQYDVVPADEETPNTHHDEMHMLPSNAESAKQEMDSMHHEDMADHDGHDRTATEHALVASEKPVEVEVVKPKVIASSHWKIIPNLHPLIVHFPIVLTLIAFLFNCAAHLRRTFLVSTYFAATGHFALWLAALSAAIALVFGWLAFNSVNHDEAGHVAMLLHRAWAVPTAIGLILLASWDAWKHRINEHLSIPALMLLFILSGAIGVTAWLGGEVVYRHGIGVLSMPSSSGEGHAHHHATTEADSNEHSEHHHDGEQGELHEH